MRQHCKQKEKNGLAHYQDDKSAINFNRPDFQRMLNSERFHAEEANRSFEQYLGSIQVNKEVADLYSSILRDVFEQNEGSREIQINEIDSRIATFPYKLKSLDDKFLSSLIGDDDYRRMVKSLKEDIRGLAKKKRLCQYLRQT